MAISLDDPKDGASRLFSAPLTAAGSASSFDPLPPAALAGAGGAVRTNFISFAFDAHAGSNRSRRMLLGNSSGGGGAALGTTGTTRLEFKNAGDGSTVPVANLSAPITFTLPASAAVSGATQAACVYWDEAAAAYSSAGCAALPNPLPRGLTASWLSGAYVDGPPTATWAMRWALADDGTGLGSLLLEGWCAPPPPRVSSLVACRRRAPLSPAAGFSHGAPRACPSAAALCSSTAATRRA